MPMATDDEVLKYVRLRMLYHSQVRKTASKQDRYFIDAIQRELMVVEKFALACSKGDRAEVERMRTNMIASLDPTYTLDI